jgi:hypothetical protein
VDEVIAADPIEHLTGRIRTSPKLRQRSLVLGLCGPTITLAFIVGAMSFAVELLGNLVFEFARLARISLSD